MKKNLKQLFIVLCLFVVPLGMNAQTLVFHLAGGAKTTVSLPAMFSVTPSGDNLVIGIDGGNNIELAKDEIMCVTYRDAKGDVNGDQRVDVADVSTLVGLLIGSVDGDIPSTDIDESPSSLIGTWTGTVYAHTWYLDKDYYATTTQITFNTDPFRFNSGKGYWVDYYNDTGAPWDYIANHINWRVDNGCIIISFSEDEITTVISDFNQTGNYFSGYILGNDNNVNFRLCHVDSPNWDCYDRWGFAAWINDDWYK